MKEHSENGIRIRLKESLPQTCDELSRDLWPKMLRRMDEGSLARKIPWFDWALIGALIAFGFAFPGMIPVLLYHL